MSDTDHHHHDRRSGSCGCGCTPEFLLTLFDSAGRDLSRRTFLKYAGLAGASLAAGGFVSSSLSGCAKKTVAGTIYHGGPILTMLRDGDRVEAVAVTDGTIQAAGTLKELLALKGPETDVIDLKGRCLMPGFIDPHSHLVMQSAKFAVANLDPKPIGEAGSIGDIQRIMREWIETSSPEPGKWVLGWGYDDTGIVEQRHPDRDDLDAVSTDYPILLVHISGHLMTGNSRMLEVCGITAETKDPEGGKIQRRQGSNEPNGVLEENAMFLVAKQLPVPTPAEAMDMIQKGLQFYAEAGITTAQDCASSKGTMNLLTAMAKEGRLPIDVVMWPMYKATDDDLFNQVVARRKESGRLRIGGMKLTIDGSIQGYTAYLSKPYYVEPGNVAPTPDKCNTDKTERIFVSDEGDAGNASPLTPDTDEGHRGYSSMTQEQVDSWVSRCDRNALQMQVHTNGDAATDMLLEAVEKSRGDKPRPELRTTIIHAQTMRDDQLDFSARHGLTPSFFPIHVYFWGDRHRDIFLGPERAARISPARSALDRNMKITLHHDAPIAGIGMLNVAWAAVNRVTSSGKPLGPEEKITPYEALRAITADAAWQHFAEDRKGTIETGKMADFVVLSDDPLEIDPMKIRNISVLETIKEGKSIFRSEG